MRDLNMDCIVVQLVVVSKHVVFCRVTFKRGALHLFEI
jgi:hypothetical protein